MHVGVHEAGRDDQSRGINDLQTLTGRDFLFQVFFHIGNTSVLRQVLLHEGDGVVRDEDVHGLVDRKGRIDQASVLNQNHGFIIQEEPLRVSLPRKSAFFVIQYRYHLSGKNA